MCHIELMAESPEWDPHATWFQEQELVMTDSTGNICDRPVGWSTKRLVATVCSVYSQASQPDSDFGLALEWMVQVKSFVVVASEHAYIKLVKVMKSSKRGQPISAMQLAKNWGVGFAAAKKTLAVTTQKGVCTMLHPTLSQ